jgi:hypothetical protein
MPLQLLDQKLDKPENSDPSTESDEEINDPNYPIVVCQSAHKDISLEGYPCVKFSFLVQLLKSIKTKKILMTCYEKSTLVKFKGKVDESKFRAYLPKSRYYLSSKSGNHTELGINVVDLTLENHMGYWMLKYDDYIEAINEWAEGKFKDEFDLNQLVYVKFSHAIDNLNQYPILHSIKIIPDA